MNRDRSDTAQVKKQFEVLIDETKKLCNDLKEDD